MIAKRLAIVLATHSTDFDAIAAHTERFVVSLRDELFDECGISRARARPPGVAGAAATRAPTR